MLRLDLWLDVACVFKTRSEAQRACKSGRVLLNGRRGKAHHEIHVNDEIEIAMTGGRKRRLSVTALAHTHIPKSEARALYTDVTPPPTPEEQELRDLLRRAGPVPGAPTRHRGPPDERERRALQKLRRRR